MRRKVFLSILVFFSIFFCLVPYVFSEMVFPLKPYAENDYYLGWGGLNEGYSRCGKAGKHLADDIGIPAGTNVYSIFYDGEVKYAGKYKSAPDWGALVVVEYNLGSQKFFVVYGHTMPVQGVATGSRVNLGQIIGQIVEWKNIPHLHFSIFDGPYDGNFSCNASSCNIPGYMCQDTWPGGFVDPVAFIKEHEHAVNFDHSFYNPSDYISIFNEYYNNMKDFLGDKVGGPYWLDEQKFPGVIVHAYQHGRSLNKVFLLKSYLV